MSTSERGKIQVELGRVLTEFTQMTDSGDNRIFTAGTLWSGKSGYEPDIRPNGVVTGSNILSTHANDDTVAVAGFTAYSKGTLHTVAAISIALTRPSTDDHKICSIIMDDTGTIDEVEGTEGTSFSSTRGEAGGPPLIPVDAVEVGQVKFDSQSSAVISESEIYQDIGQHCERYDYPAFTYDNIGKGKKAATTAEKNAHVKFYEALPAVHTGSVAKAVYIQYYTPTLSTVPNVSDFKAAEVGISKSSTKVYKGDGGSGVIGSVSADSVGDASFTLYANDGITDPIVDEAGEMITVKYFQDANKTPFVLTQGALGIDRKFPAGDNTEISCTLYCEKASVGFNA